MLPEENVSSIPSIRDGESVEMRLRSKSTPRDAKGQTTSAKGRASVSSTAARGESRAAETELVTIAANQYIVSHYPIGFLAGTPRRLWLDGRDLWIVPIVLTSPGYGAVGEVGVVAIDADSRRPAGSTSRAEVAAAARRLREEKHEDLEAAFRRARKI
jgi:hypothetical protein